MSSSSSTQDASFDEGSFRSDDTILSKSYFERPRITYESGSDDESPWEGPKIPSQVVVPNPLVTMDETQLLDELKDLKDFEVNIEEYLVNCEERFKKALLYESEVKDKIRERIRHEEFIDTKYIDDLMVYQTKVIESIKVIF